MGFRWRYFWLMVFALVATSSAMAADYDKRRPLHGNLLHEYSAQQIFDAAYQAYICSFLMSQAGQSAKGQFLRWYSQKLMMAENVRDSGRNWNDVNFPGALEATAQVQKYVGENGVAERVAAAELLRTKDCGELVLFAERALRAGR